MDKKMMFCPKGCIDPLVVLDRSGIEIDYCPSCRGVWLDRGELETLIQQNDRPEVRPQERRPEYRPEQSRDRERHYSRDDDDYKRRKKKSFLSEIFDFD
jgi:Zn-finger nucleic acid-binding protein